MFRIRSQIPLHVMEFVSRIKGLGACKAQARRHVTQIFRFRLVLLGTPPPSSDP